MNIHTQIAIARLNLLSLHLRRAVWRAVWPVWRKIVFCAGVAYAYSVYSLRHYAAIPLVKLGFALAKPAEKWDRFVDERQRLMRLRHPERYRGK